MESVSEETLLSVLKKLQELEENQTLFLNKFEKLDENTEAIIKIQTAFIQIKEKKAKDIERVKDIVENKLYSFLTINGLKKLFRSKQFYQKVASSLFMLTLCVTCVIILIQNGMEYMAHTVVTQVRNHYVESLEFPLFTMCPMLITQNGIVPIENNSLELENQFELQGQVEFTTTLLSVHPFYDKVKCYQFNAKRDSLGNERTLWRFKNAGLVLVIRNIPKNSLISYSITHNSYLPTESELNNFIQPGSYTVVRVDKTIDQKLSEPYNHCVNDLESHTSTLVKRIEATNITYRRENCLEICRDDIISQIRSSMNTSRFNAVFEYYEGQGQTYKDCDQLCPLECERIMFTTVENSILLTKDYYDIDWENITLIRIVYDKLKYTTVTQTPKTLFVDLISNNGGVLGLFLDVSFVGIYKSIVFIIDVLKYLVSKK